MKRSDRRVLETVVPFIAALMRRYGLTEVRFSKEELVDSPMEIGVGTPGAITFRLMEDPGARR